MRKQKENMKVQAKDTYDPADYISVHYEYFNGLKRALRRAHQEKTGDPCICIYCRDVIETATDLNGAPDQSTEPL